MHKFLFLALKWCEISLNFRLVAGGGQHFDPELANLCQSACAAEMLGAPVSRSTASGQSGVRGAALLMMSHSRGHQQHLFLPTQTNILHSLIEILIRCTFEGNMTKSMNTVNPFTVHWMRRALHSSSKTKMVHTAPNKMLFPNNGDKILCLALITFPPNVLYSSLDCSS